MAKIKVKRLEQESAHRQTDTHVHTDATKYIISPATQLINIWRPASIRQKYTMFKTIEALTPTHFSLISEATNSKTTANCNVHVLRVTLTYGH